MQFSRISAAWSAAVAGRPSRLAVLPGMGQASPTRSRRISRSNSAKTASRPAMARPAGVVRSSASVSDTKPTPRCSSSWSVASRSVTDRPQRSSRHTSTTSISRRRAASSSFSRSSRWLHRSRPRGPAGRSSSRAGRHTPAWRGSASGGSAGRSWKRGRTGQRGTFSPVSVPGQKRYRDFAFSEGPFGGHFRVSPQHGRRRSFSARHGFIILRGAGVPAAPASRGSSTASTPTGSLSTPRRAAATRSGSRTGWRRSARRCGSGS